MLNLVANGPSGYNLTNSLRFRSSASAYLSRTPASATNRQIWTLSMWVKRGKVGAEQGFFGAGTSGSDFSLFEFQSNDTMMLYGANAGATSFQLITTQVFRDPSAWYHVVIAFDTTQATASNRIKLYINGSQVTAFGTATYSAQNYNTFINNTNAHVFGNIYNGGSPYLDGYLTEINFIDGQALTPSSFGSTNATTGVWQPAKYTGTYGTNGFYLNFSNIALTSGSNTGLGKDYSGNGNYWNTNNISVTAGTTYDAMTDSPTLTNTTVGNYATFNPLKNPFPDAVSYTNGNLSVSVGTGNQTPALATIYPSSGKWYWEVTWTSGSYARIGVQNTTVASTDFGADVYGWRWESNTGNIYNGGVLSTAPASYVAGDILGFCLDLDAGKLYVSKNGTWQNSAVPASGTGAVATNIPTGTPMSPAVATGSLTSVFALNCGQRPFSYTPPTGFNAINTYNLPTPTIKAGNKYMDATLYTGTGSALTITNTASFQPDFVWIKGRSSAYNHALFDSVRGALKVIQSNSTAAEATESAGTSLTGFNSNGFALGTNGSTVSTNVSGQTFVGWQWQAGQGSTSSNTSGTITSTVSVNATAGFSIVSFTGTGANATVGHGLGVAPAMVIIKNRDSGVQEPLVWHKSLASGSNYLKLNTTDASLSAANVWNSTIPTSTVISVGSSAATNGSTNKIIAWIWAEIAGFSKFGSYTGNGSSDGPFVATNFRPKFVMIKNTTTAGYNWVILDSSRDTYNYCHLELYPNTSGAEVNASSLYQEDFLSNGFKIRQTDATWNANGSTYIYMAFAEVPFKYSLAR